MASPDLVVERRKNPRAQLHLPARIRWQGPLGMRLEVTKTVDVSREGVLLHRNETSQLSSRAWIVFPYHRAIGAYAQPETPARIARVALDENGGYWVAVRLEPAVRPSSLPVGQERRRSERSPLALPIFVRIDGTRWPEESMTQDVSENGARFETSHAYTVADTVVAKIPWGEWGNAGEISGRVVRVESLDDAREPALVESPVSRDDRIRTSVAVEWTNLGVDRDKSTTQS
jgi:hypothetical protein